MEVNDILVYEVSHGYDVHYFYDSLDLLPAYLRNRGVRKEDAYRVMYLCGDLEAGYSSWFPYCGVTVSCREVPPIGSQGPR